jgi:hypothetical protein
MAKYIRAAPANDFTVEQVTQGQSYPAQEAQKYLDDPGVANEPDVSEDQAKAELAQLVDTSSVKRRGTGTGAVYAYGYRCAPDRLKVGCTDGDTVQRIAAQIGTSTPDTPVLFLEIRTRDSRALERALHSVLAYRGQKVNGGGAEWFRTSTDEIERLCDFLDQNPK